MVDFLGEEPNDFGLSCVGSRAIAGALDEAHLALQGRTDAAWPRPSRRPAGRPSALAGARWPDELHCYLELHIEQGPVLEQARVPIGVVTGIAGIHRLLARIKGQPDHAGTTPMEPASGRACRARPRRSSPSSASRTVAWRRWAASRSGPGPRTSSRPRRTSGPRREAPSETWLEDFGRKVTEELERYRRSASSCHHPQLDLPRQSRHGDRLGGRRHRQGCAVAGDRAARHPQWCRSRRLPHGAAGPDGHGLRAVPGGSEPLPGGMDGPRGHRPGHRRPCAGDDDLRLTREEQRLGRRRNGPHA